MSEVLYEVIESYNEYIKKFLMDVKKLRMIFEKIKLRMA